jgi:hypothetical protein
MHDTRTLLAADAAQIVDVVEQRVDERPAGVAGGGMDDHARRLVHDDDVVVLIDDGERQGFGAGSASTGSRISTEICCPAFTG